ncbi:DNA-formamidopyrimidine glycosylase family protein [Microbacterium gilvum]|uniref:DNA-(apurinic or apyrimidinic site) lyase n=1 Tax=Microbacterium gilvum TaxID=1336204 RepID=A0ABP9A8E9_9MICO
MPEGDSVHRAARRLHVALAGRAVTRFDLRVPKAATADLRGETVHGVVARGKHLLHRIGEHTLHTHLRMEGEWHVYPPGGRWRRPAYQARAIVCADGADTVGFELGIVELLRTRDEDSAVGHLGPDPLGPDWDPDEAARRLSLDTRAAHVALLDQRNVAGFGTEYVNELLFLRGIAPTRRMADVDTAALVDLGARTIRRNVDQPQRSFTGDARPGRRMWVYGRERRPCLRCGSPVRKSAMGPDPTRERLVYWCPVCQPAE